MDEVSLWGFKIVLISREVVFLEESEGRQNQVLKPHFP